MEESSSDIVVKYHKLAAEYSKLRAQVTVLKKAISEEQGKNQDLKETLKDKDQSVRKLQQEIECLNFRNLQLTKRVSVLQDDLEATEEKLKKSKNKNLSDSISVPSVNSSILNTELLSRIEENEKLHQQVFQDDIEHKKIVLELNSQLQTLKSKLEQQELLYTDIIKKHEAVIEKLSEERAKFELTLKNQEKDIKDVKLKDEICESELQYIKKDLGAKLDDVSKILAEKVLFNDTRWNFQNGLNVPILLNAKHNQLSLMIGDIAVILTEVVGKLSDLHTYMKQKLVATINLSYGITGPNKRLADLLHDNRHYLKNIETTFIDFSSKIQENSTAWLGTCNLKNVMQSFSSYVSYLNKLLPYLLLSIQMEDAAKGTTPRLKDLFSKLQIVSKKLILNFDNLEKYIHILAETSCPNKNSEFCINRYSLINKILSCLSSLHFHFEDAMKIFSAKVVLDHQLPTSVQISKTTDECILSCMVSVSNYIKKITALLEGKKNLMNDEIPYRCRGFRTQKKICLNPCVSKYQERGVKYMKILREKETESIPCDLALKNCQALNKFVDSRENLSQQLQACQNKLTKIELEKEHWMLECQLLKSRQARTSPISSEGINNSFPGDDETLQLFMKTSVNQLVAQMQFADSTASAFQTECEYVHQKLKLSEQQKKLLEKQFLNAEISIGTLKEEQQSLIKNYEDQLSTMSEHLAALNETLTSQKDEIDVLKHTGNNKTSKKIKGK